jgi:hypothetical protein
MTVMHFQEDVTSHIGKILRKNKNKLGRRHKPDVTGKLRREVRQLAEENRYKVNDLQCLLVYQIILKLIDS